MWRRFVIYGGLGWMLEVLMTGASAVVHGRDRCATAKTYLWMHPIYGAGGLLLEQVSARLGRRVPRTARALAYVPVIYGVEYGTGWLLRRAIGRCPWDYGDRGLNLSGLVRADYAPLWLAVAYLFETVRDRVASLDGS